MAQNPVEQVFWVSGLAAVLADSDMCLDKGEGRIAETDFLDYSWGLSAAVRSGGKPAIPQQTPVLGDVARDQKRADRPAVGLQRGMATFHDHGRAVFSEENIFMIRYHPAHGKSVRENAIAIR